MQMQGARSEGDVGVVDTTLRRTSKRNAVDAGICAVAVNGW
jgi:hypothetical protein